MILRVPARIMAQMIEHVERQYPEEGAGVILGRDTEAARIVDRVLPAENTYQPGDRTRRYQISPQVLLSAERQAEEHGLEVLGIFHSHPDHPAEASEFDLQWALPWYSYLIISVERGRASRARAWRLASDRTVFEEEPLEPIGTET
jgi:proteasome lid subunit RPN8/RPN11